MSDTEVTTVCLLLQDSVCVENLPNTCWMPQRIYLTPLILIYIKYWKVLMIYNSPSLVISIIFEKPGGASGKTAAVGCETGALRCDWVSLAFEYTTAIGSSSQAPGYEEGNDIVILHRNLATHILEQLETSTQCSFGFGKTSFQGGNSVGQRYREYVDATQRQVIFIKWCFR